MLVDCTLHSFDVLQLQSQVAALHSFPAEQLQALTLLAIDAHDAGYNVGLIFFGLGSAVYSMLFFQSGYVPRALSALGVVASLLCAIFTFAFVVFPEFADLATPGCFEPIVVFELAIGGWLLVKGFRVPLPAKVAEFDT